MEAVIAYEEARGCQVYDVHEKNLGYDITSLDVGSGELRLIEDPARFPWHEVTKVAHYYLSVDAMTKPMRVREDSPPYGTRE